MLFWEDKYVDMDVNESRAEKTCTDTLANENVCLDSILYFFSSPLCMTCCMQYPSIRLI